jgi:hypothetical protein
MGLPRVDESVGLGRHLEAMPRPLDAEPEIAKSVRRWLETDEAATAALKVMAADPASGTMRLMEALKRRSVPNDIRTAVHGGQVGTIINIASLESLSYKHTGVTENALSAGHAAVVHELEAWLGHLSRVAVVERVSRPTMAGAPSTRSWREQSAVLADVLDQTLYVTLQKLYEWFDALLDEQRQMRDRVN